MLLSRSSVSLVSEGPGLNLMSSCPHLVVVMGGVSVLCLVDNGSMVSTITESCFCEYFEPWDQERLKTCQWLQLRAANGLSIPYIGYIELDVELCGKLVPKCGVLVVRDPPDGICAQAPGVLAMNILGRCYQELFGQYGPSLFDSPSVLGASQVVFQVLQHCHQASLQLPTEVMGKVKVRGPRASRIPGGVIKLVAATCSEKFSSGVALFEPLESGLPAGLLASPALIRVTRGTVYVPVVNVGTIDALLFPRRVIGTLTRVDVVSPPSGVTEIRPFLGTVCSIGSQVGAPAVQEQMDAVDLSSLAEEKQNKVRALLRKYQSIFSTGEGDLGCTDLILRDIPLLDDVPVRNGIGAYLLLNMK